MEAEPVDLAALERELMELRRRANAPDYLPDDETLRALVERIDALDARAAAAPARTLADVLVKLRLLEYDENRLCGGWNYELSGVYFRTAYDALERMAAGGG